VNSGERKGVGRVILVTTDGGVARRVCASLDELPVDYVVCANLYEAVEEISFCESRDTGGVVILAGRLSEFCRDGGFFFNNVFSPDTMECVCLVGESDVLDIDRLKLAIVAGAYPAGNVDAFCDRLWYLAGEFSKAGREAMSCVRKTVAAHQQAGSEYRRRDELGVFLTLEEREALLGS